MFENKTVIGHKLYKKYIERAIYKSMIFWLIPISISGFLSVYLFYYSSIDLFLNIFSFFSLFLFIFIMILINNFNRYSEFKRLGVSDIEFNIFFNDDYILLKGRKKDLYYKYNEVIAYDVFLDYSVLYVSHNTVIWLCEDCFLKGNKDEFHNFILEKCPKIKRIRYSKSNIIKSN